MYVYVYNPLPIEALEQEWQAVVSSLMWCCELIVCKNIMQLLTLLSHVSRPNWILINLIKFYFILFLREHPVGPRLAWNTLSNTKPSTSDPPEF